MPLLITNPTNIRYLTGFVGAAPEERESYLLVTDNTAYLFTNSLYLENARSQLLNCYIAKLLHKPVALIEASRENPLSKELAKLTKKLGIQKLEFEEANLTVAEYNKLTKELKGLTLVPTKNRIEDMRMIKRDDEIENIKEAGRITDKCFSYILTILKPGVSETDIAWEILSFFRKDGATEAFSPIVAFGSHSSMPHYAVTGDKRQVTRLGKNDVALLDFGARVNGYCADMTRVVFVGRPKKEWIYAYSTVLESQKCVFDALKKYFDLSINRSGPVAISGAALDSAARSVIAKAGLPVYPHSLGHNVGLDIHEGPRLSISKDETLKPDMVFSVEPGVYLEGQYGIRIEDLVRLTHTGIEILSQSPKKLTIL